MSAGYWETRYKQGKGSGRGSRGEWADRKADLVNRVIDVYNPGTILDLGSGDGVVASGIIHPDYLGVDPSKTAVNLARKAAPQHRFGVFKPPPPTRELHLSLDVIRHLVDPAVYYGHLLDLFSAEWLVAVWSTDVNKPWSDHEQERHWTLDVPDGWTLLETTVVSDTTSEFTVWGRE
jgi:SAM-dependent methyltransferase